MAEREKREKGSNNLVHAGSLAFDWARDHAFGEGVDWLAGKIGVKLESESGGKVLGKMASKGASAPASAAVEIGKGVWKLRNDKGRAGDYEKGLELERAPWWYQAGNAVVSTADAASQYGAVMEARGRKMFEDENKVDPGVQSFVDGLNNAALRREESEKRAFIAASMDRLGLNSGDVGVPVEPDYHQLAMGIARRIRETFGF